MSERKPLNQTICLRRIHGSGKEEFTIIGLKDNGSSVLCYDAKYAEVRGILKEFYPEYAASALCRDSNGHLIPTGSDDSFRSRYEQEKERYLRPYEILLTIRNNSTDGELDNFIPSFELFEGRTDDGKPCGTVYVWSPQRDIKTFQSLLDDKELSSQPEKKLSLILKIIHRLTSCVWRLHREKLIHRDINPRNVGITEQDGQVLPDYLLLFDVNTISYIYDEDHAVVGTEGYIEPHAGIFPFNESTDIYSIGATLFSAVVITEETTRSGHRYYDNYFGHLKEMVAASELIHNSAKNSCHEICDLLVTILRKCLAPSRSMRYQNCEELNKDLLKALDKWEELGSLDQVSLNEKIREEKCSWKDMLFHFYRKPLYGNACNSDDKLRVLLLGFSGYSRKYLDALLQMGQMIDKKLFATIVTENYDLFRSYKTSRPALEDFFDIDGSLLDVAEEDVYGHIHVIDARALTDYNDNHILNQRVIRDLMDQVKPHRVFISLENDAKNIAAAHFCGSPNGCMISYASTDEPVSEQSDGFVAVPVTRRFRDSDEYEDLKRMAFNAHLVWKNDLLAINQEMIQEFNDKSHYFSNSSISNVISVKYKLFMAGVNLDKPGMTLHKAAELFQQKTQESEDKTIRNQLIWTEHRRWEAEKVCQGWKCLDDLEKCPIGDTKITGDKLHTCLVRSRSDSRLSDLVSADPQKWDSLTEEEYASLDELDRLSVDLHRKYREMAARIESSSLLSSNIIASIESLAKDNPNVDSVYQEWYACVSAIATGIDTRYKLYRRLSQSLKNICKCNDPMALNQLKSLLRMFDEMFAPMLEASHLLNLKKNDDALIDSIPFILTYDKKLKLVIPFVTGSFSELFENVAAATVINPEQITYLYIAEHERALVTLRDTLPRIAAYTVKKGLRAEFSLVLFLGSSLDDNYKVIRQKLSENSGGLLTLEQIKCYHLEHTKPLSQRIKQMLDKDKKHSVVFQYFDSTYNGLSGILFGGGLYNATEHFSFDTGSQSFNRVSSQCPVKYISQKVKMSVADMMAFGLSISSSGMQPTFYRNYQILWNKYAENNITWKLLCDMLGKHDEKNSVIARFSLKSSGNPVVKSCNWPAACLDSAKKILDNLKEYEIVGRDSSVKPEADYCRITVTCSQSRVNEINNFFRIDPNQLLWADKRSCFKKKEDKDTNIVITLDDLKVTNFIYDSDKSNHFVKYNKLLKFWEDNGCIYNLNEGQSISFYFSSPSYKKLLTCSGKMLEVYVFQKLREQAGFDNVVSGCEINWGSNLRNLNELDCVVTKGFRSVFIECKSTDLETDFYYKLDSLVKTLGINAIPVIIDDKAGGAPDVKIRRGDDMGIRTITNPSEIKNIGQTIMNLLKD